MNTLELKKHVSGSYEVTIFCNGVTSWELFPSYKKEIDILENLKDRKFYQNYKGDWCFTLPDDHKLIKDKDFNKAVQMAISFIHERDMPAWDDHF